MGYNWTKNFRYENTKKYIYKLTLLIIFCVRPN